MDIQQNSPTPTPNLTAAPIHFGMVYLSAIILSFFSHLPAYAISTYMKQFVSAQTVSLLYSLGSAISVILFLSAPFLLRKFGNMALAIVFTVICTISMGFLGLALSATSVIIAFLAFMAVCSLIFLNIDIFSESLIGDNEQDTGKKRGLLLSLMAVAGLLSPVTMGFLIGPEGNMEILFFFTALIGLVLTFVIIGGFRRFFDPIYETMDLKRLSINLSANRDLRLVLGASLLLQIFFTWMVVYVPLYLATEIGLSWSSISLIITIALTAFVIIEYPAGLLADEKWGEQEMMIIGFIFICGSAFALSFISTTSVLVWAIALFCTRVGASLVEVTTESYFFKQVSSDNADLLSTFRLMRPIGSMIGALIGTVCLFFLPFSYIFAVLGAVCLLGFYFSISLRDTK